MTNRPERGPDAHAGHDALLIAAYAADDVEAGDRQAAENLLATCAKCAQLAVDLQLIVQATADLPATVRPRDFTLTPEQAARLRGTSWRSLAGRLGWIRTDFGRTLAAGLTTLGLAGLLIGVIPSSIPMGLGGAAASSPAPAAVAAPAPQSGQRGSAFSGASAAPSGLPQQPAATGTETYSGDGVGIAGERQSTNPQDTSSGGAPGKSAEPPGRDSGVQASTPNFLLVPSLAALGLGVGLFALRRAASISRR
jgi:hypothetical protein